ncbi:hypothetical protein [Alienimonas californiensis]|uniref:Late embryogenesis abundant protein n=1 Tax=Alienimonas californiensis TaxID=2527989 RepID=A0A517PBV8_9PLAN|nr:hypothetical protein [Alienimonas californiensis]QDT16860.1 hypothetical protein CA12_29680 [Alienimonas californiensis]
MPATDTPPSDKAKAQLADGRDELSQKTAQAKSAAGDAARNVGQEAHAAADQAGAALSDAAKQAKARAGELVDSAKHEAYARAEEAKSAVRQKVSEYTETGKKKAASEVNTYGSAISKAAEELEKNDDPAAPMVRAAADRVQKFGEYLDGRDATDLLDQAENFARRHPEVVLGGMFVLGLGLARFLKSTREPLPNRGSASGNAYAGNLPARTGPAAPQYGTHTGSASGTYGSGSNSGSGQTAPNRLSNPSPKTGGRVTVLEETSTVVPGNPK